MEKGSSLKRKRVGVCQGISRITSVSSQQCVLDGIAGGGTARGDAELAVDGGGHIQRQKGLHRGQLLHHDPDQHGNQKIVEYQDRWTMSPSRARIWLNGSGNHTQYNNTRLPW